MRFILFFKIFNISWKFQKWKESSEKRFCFSDNSSCICCVKLRREYLSWAVKFFKKCPKTSFIWKRFSNSISEPWKRWKKYCAADFSCVWYTLACWLLKGVLKRGFWDIFIKPRFWQSEIFEIHKRWESSFFYMFKIWYSLQKFSKRLRKRFFSEIIVFEQGAVDSSYYEENTCHQQTMC